MTPDLTGTRANIVEGRACAREAIEASITAAHAEVNLHTYTRLEASVARATAAQVDALHATGAPVPPLAGLAVSVKDLFDVQGEVTAAGSTVLAGRPAAAEYAGILT